VSGLLAVRLGLSAIPIYIGAGILLGPGEPVVLHVVTPNDATDLISRLGIVLLCSSWDWSSRWSVSPRRDGSPSWAARSISPSRAAGR
jgi:Kef-type K+ transport systems, membrane components